MDQANCQLTSVNDFFVAGIVRTWARPSLSRPQREKGGRCDTKTGTFFSALFIAHSTETFIRSRDRGRPLLLQMTWDQWVWVLTSEWAWAVTSLAKHWHQAWPWHRPGLPRTLIPGPDVTAINHLHQPILRSDEQYPDHWEQCTVTNRSQARTGPQTLWWQGNLELSLIRD